LAIFAITWRMHVTHSRYGVLIILGCCVAILGPFALAGLGVMPSMYDFRDGTLVLLPKLHDYPRIPALASMLMATCGAIGVSVLFGRFYINELRRTEERIHFQAWQLQQLVPPAES